MATKTITIKDAAYERLKELKDGRSFSDVIIDLTDSRKVDLMSSFGSLSEEQAEEAREKVEKFKESFEKDADEALRS